MYLTDLESIKAREIGVKVCSIPSSKLLTADWLDRVLPFFEEQGVSLLRILTDRGSEYSGNREYHEYELYLQVEGIEHTKTRTKSPQTNGICERFQRTILNGFYQVAFRTKVYGSIEDLRVDLDAWLSEYNEKRFSLVEILLWQDTHADISGYDPYDQGEDDRIRGSGMKHSGILTKKLINLIRI